MNIMISIETLAMDSLDAYILGIGAVAFEPKSGYLSEDVHSFRWISPLGSDYQGQGGGVIEPGIVKSWMGRNDSWRRVRKDDCNGTLAVALSRLDGWVDEATRGICSHIWARHPQFSLVTLRRAAVRLGAPWRLAWGHWRDLSVLADLASRFEIEEPFEENWAWHDPLDDARRQAALALAVFRALRVG